MRNRSATLDAVEKVQAWASTRPRYLLAGALVALLLAGLLHGIAALDFYHWELGTGLLFITLWCSPRRWWPWALGAAMFSHSHTGLLTSVAEPLLVMAGVLVLNAWDVRPGGQVTLRRIVEQGRPGILAVLQDATALKTLEAQFVQSQTMLTVVFAVILTALVKICTQMYGWHITERAIGGMNLGYLIAYLLCIQQLVKLKKQHQSRN